MGGRDDGLSPERAERSRRMRELTRIHAVLGSLLLLIVLQFLLLMVGMEGWLAGKMSRVGPTAAVSALCFAGACLLVRGLAGRSTS